MVQLINLYPYNIYYFRKGLEIFDRNLNRYEHKSFCQVHFISFVVHGSMDTHQAHVDADAKDSHKAASVAIPEVSSCDFGNNCLDKQLITRLLNWSTSEKQTSSYQSSLSALNISPDSWGLIQADKIRVMS